jgi:hypothetical protein
MQREKTIREQIEDIKGDFCEMCCKHYEEAEAKAAAYKEDDSIEDEYKDMLTSEINNKLEHDFCRICPLNRL